MDDLEEAIRNIESRTGVRPGFFADLLKEDDWSFVVKAHALLESACAEILTERTGAPELTDTFSRMELSAKATGKIAFLKAFGLAIGREIRFISCLSELRNSLVHNARNTTFNLVDYVAGMDKNQRKSFVDTFGYAYLTDDENGKEIIGEQQKILDNPKESMWLGLKYVLGILSIQIDKIRIEREINGYQAELGKAIFKAKEKPS